jgi:hypothetical protein
MSDFVVRSCPENVQNVRECPGMSGKVSGMSDQGSDYVQTHYMPIAVYRNGIVGTAMALRLRRAIAVPQCIAANKPIAVQQCIAVSPYIAVPRSPAAALR